MSSYYPGFQRRVLCPRPPVENKPKHFPGSSTSASKRLSFLSVCVLLVQAHCSFYNHLSDSLRGQQGAGGGEEGCSVPQITIPLLLLPLSRALTTGHRSPVTPPEPVHTLLAHCDSLDSDSTAGTHNVLIGQGCMWCPPPPPSPLQPTALSVCCW